MFGRIYGMLAGDDDALPVPRRTTPAIAVDAAGGFVSVEGAAVDDVRWPLRGERPGGVPDPQTPGPGELTLAEEMRRLAQERADRATETK